jgi:serine protease Do
MGGAESHHRAGAQALARNSRLAATGRAVPGLGALASAMFAVVLTLLGAAPPALGDDVSRMFKRVTSAVVVVHTVERRTVPLESGEGVSKTKFAGLGSGILVSEDGLIVTAAHVVQSADEVEVEFIDHQRIVAEIVGASTFDDVALLRLTLPVHGIASAKWADSEAVDVGDPVFVVGAPYGLDHTLTSGRISGRRPRGGTDLGPGSPQGDLFLTDAALNRGNSGGPVFDLNGNVVGIVSFILSASGGFEGLGFAVPSNTVRRALFEKRSIWTGIAGVLLSGDVARALQLPQDAGYLVQQVARYSPAEAAGLRPGRIPAVIDGETLLLGGDIVLAVDSMQVDASAATGRKILEYLGQRPAGTVVKLRILRDGALEVVSFVPH